MKKESALALFDRLTLADGSAPSEDASTVLNRPSAGIKRQAVAQWRGDG